MMMFSSLPNMYLLKLDDYNFRMTAMPGLDMSKVNLVFDFGGNPDNTEITITNVILKESK